MFVSTYFSTIVWSEEKPEFVKSLNKASDKYIINARKKEKDHIKKYGDFGKVYHSTLTVDNNFLNFRNYVGQKSWEYLDRKVMTCHNIQLCFLKYGYKNFLKKVVAIIQHIYIGINMYQVLFFKMQR